MAGVGNPTPRRPSNSGQRSEPQPPLTRRPPQVVMIRKDEPSGPEPSLESEPEHHQPAVPAAASPPRGREPAPSSTARGRDDEDLVDLQGLTMADLLASEAPDAAASRARTASRSRQTATAAGTGAGATPARTVDDFDFDEEAFLAALGENEPVGTTGAVVHGVVIGIESDGVYVDIGGKAPGFMPKQECGLGVITNLKERFPKGLEVDVLVTREQNADGMVTVSARALALRQSWEKVRQLEKDGKVLQVKINGFNRGGVT